MKTTKGQLCYEMAAKNPGLTWRAIGKATSTKRAIMSARSYAKAHQLRWPLRDKPRAVKTTKGQLCYEMAEANPELTWRAIGEATSTSRPFTAAQHYAHRQARRWPLKYKQAPTADAEAAEALAAMTTERDKAVARSLDLAARNEHLAHALDEARKAAPQTADPYADLLRVIDDRRDALEVERARARQALASIEARYDELADLGDFVGGMS